MKKILSILFFSYISLQAYMIPGSNSINPINFNAKVNNTIGMYKKNSHKEKMSYKDLIEFLKSSGDKNKIMILGVLYSHDSKTPDDYGNYIKADIALSKKYLLRSYKMGNKKALTILGGLIFYNDKMAKLDPKLEDTEKYLETSFYKDKVFEAGLLLANVQLVKGEYSKGIQTLIKLSEMGDSSAQLEMALIFQKGIYSQKDKKMVIEKSPKIAEMYLNKACNNENKSNEVRKFCYSKYVVTGEK